MITAGLLMLTMSNPDRIDLLTRAHAHNDYAHTRPLFDALDNGFCSVEADVYLVDGELRVGHDRGDLKSGRTLQSLYLDPLKERVAKNHGSVYATKAPFTLLVDIKADGAAVYRELERISRAYLGMLTSFDGKLHPGAITIILSGDRPIADLQRETHRIAFIDGRLPDLDSNPPVTLTPLVSDSFERRFHWNGTGDMPADDRSKLKEFVRRAHEQKRKIRFWATPDTVACWAEMYKAGVDLINTDDLPGLRRFLLTKRRR